MTKRKIMKRLTILVSLVVLGLMALYFSNGKNKGQGHLTKDEVFQSNPLSNQKYHDAEHITPHDFMSKLFDRTIEHEIRARIIHSPGGKNIYELNTYYYDFEKVNEIEQQVSDIGVHTTLNLLFQEVTKTVNENDHCQKWLVFSDFISKIMRHPPLTQPMYKDKTMVTHPLVLLLLGEGRCGHVARVIVDTALANGYQARLVQLAAHLVAEIKYDDSWHFIDSNADFPLEALKKLGRIPSLVELSKKPYLIDTLPARGWEWSEHNKRSTANTILSHAMWYPANLLTSSIYFGDQILKNLYSGNTVQPRKGLIYYYKIGAPQSWQKDKYYGWNNLKSEIKSIEPIPIEFFPSRPLILAPTIIYEKNQRVRIPIRFMPLKRIRIENEDIFNIKDDTNDIGYEVRVSTQSRGWDYNFRNYKYMPIFGKGDLRKITKFQHYRDGLIGFDLELNGFSGDIFIEVLPKIESLEQRGTYIWPSPELHIQIYPENYQKWNYGKK